MGFETPPVAPESKKQSEASMSDMAGFGDTTLSGFMVSADELAGMVAHDVPEAAADPKRRADVAAEIARKEKLLSHIGAYLSKNSKELMKLSADDQRGEEAYQERLEVLNKGSKEWMSRENDLEETVARLKQSISADEQFSSGPMPPSGSAVSRGVAPVPRFPLVKSRGFFSTVKDAVSQGWSALRNSFSSRKQGGYAEEETMFGAGDYSLKDGSMSEVDELETAAYSSAYASEVASVSEAADPDRYAKIAAEIKRKKDLIDKINQYLSLLVREMHRTTEGESADAFRLRLDALNADYDKWMSRYKEFEGRLSKLERMIGANTPIAQGVSVQEISQEAASFGRSTSIGSIITAIRNSLPWGAAGIERRRQLEGHASENDKSEVVVRFPLPAKYLSPMEENPFPVGQDSSLKISNETVLAGVSHAGPVAVSGLGSVDTPPKEDPFTLERYARGQALGYGVHPVDALSAGAIVGDRAERDRLEVARLKASMGFVDESTSVTPVARGDLDFDKWTAEQRQKPQAQSFGVDAATLYPVADVTAAGALEDVEAIREARESARDNQRRHPVNAEVYSAEEEVLEKSYREALDLARLSLAREIKEMPVGSAKHDRMRQFASVMKDLRQLDEQRPASPAPEKKTDDQQKAA